MKAIGVDVGGTKVAVALIEDNGTFYGRIEEPTRLNNDEILFKQVVRMIQAVIETTGTDPLQLEGIGLGVPGKVDHINGVAVMQNNIPWPHFPVVDRLKKEFPGVAIRIDNDVKVAAVAEQRLSSKVSSADVFTYLTISTGIASASIMNQQLIRGNGFTGEVGFYPVKQEESEYIRLEQFASGPSIEKAGQKIYGYHLTTKDVFDKYEQKDPKAVKLIEDCAKATAEAIYAHIMILDPQAIVLGGSVMNHQPSYVVLIKEYLSKLVVPQQARILDNITVSEIGNHNGIIGAGFIGMSSY